MNVVDRENSWSVRDIYLAHFTITDVEEDRFYTAQLASRAGPGLAGAGTEGMDVWLLDWKARMQDSVISLEAKKDNIELNLQLQPHKPLIIHGQKGLSKKGPDEGQASYYVSFTDLETSGTLKREQGGVLIKVKGRSWFDHEFGSNQLAPDQQGWDWFGLHLSDGRDLMIYQLRRKDGSIEPATSGTLVEAKGTSRHLKLADLSISVLDRWKSPQSGGTYPSRWHIRVPLAEIDLIIAPLVAHQELNTKETTGLFYWEGAVTGEGTSGKRNVACEGYVELTGYVESLGGFF
jgi:predicted secreted hydrolase